MTDTYQTIEGSSEGFYKEKGSKFFAYCQAIYNEEDVKAFLEDIKSAHPKARHHCYAYRFGLDKNQNYRANDDGEPSGTAGRPIIGQLDSKGVTNIMVIVVRYFGGTKLGVPGLIRAYKTATIDALDNATIVTKQIQDFYTIAFDYSAMNDVMKLLKRANIDVESPIYEQICQFTIRMRQSESEGFIAQLAEIEGLKVDFLYAV